MARSLNYPETLEYLFSQLPMFQRVGAAAYKADLGNTISLTELLGHPEKRFKSVHIAGTNGKGSVAHMLASVMQEAGYKTGLYTSPHLKDFRERIRINGRMVDEDYIIHFVAKHRDAFDTIKPSFFEYTAVMAFDYFAKQKVDIAIMETGMGGRLDSTNVISPELSVITNISMDHAMFLGNTLEKIASEKAGIIKKEVPVVIGESQQETDAVFLAKAREMNAPIVFADSRYTVQKSLRDGNKWLVTEKSSNMPMALDCPLLGNYQARNLATLLMAVETLKQAGYLIEAQAIENGIKNVVVNTGLQGRWQILGKKPKTICDVGHNHAGISMILEQLGNEEFKDLHWVFGLVNDKDSAQILSMLPTTARYYFCKANIPRGMDAMELKRMAETYGLEGNAYASVAEAFESAKQQAQAEDLIFVGGSTFIVAEVL